MRPTTDYIRQTAKLARKLHVDADLGGPPPQPGPDFYKALAKAMDEIAQGLEALSQRE